MALYTAPQQAEPVVEPVVEPLTWLLINQTGARPLIYGDATPAKQAEPADSGNPSF
jgi:hypothetical protein